MRMDCEHIKLLSYSTWQLLFMFDCNIKKKN